eukprot:evm.model.scf_1360EXC.4 EVM.evm.TU.scf_1360EXC.4   scf_1360EXC:29335-34456(-)
MSPGPPPCCAAAVAVKGAPRAGRVSAAAQALHACRSPPQEQWATKSNIVPSPIGGQGFADGAQRVLHVLEEGMALEAGMPAGEAAGAVGLGPAQRMGAEAVGRGLRVPVNVMLPLDTVNADGQFRYAASKWFDRALQVLVSSGVKGVAVDLWWGAVETEPRQYNWAGYKQLFEVVRSTGLKLQVVMAFHACGGNVGDVAQIPLPAWVLKAGDLDPDLFFADKPRDHSPGLRNREYLSIFADDVPGVLMGRSPLECYEDFMMSFRDTFYNDIGSLVTEVVVGAGPCGELRYPSYMEANGWRFPGVGEFQCYDRRALASLANAAAACGHPEWGNGGPHDSGHYNNSPEEAPFFAAHGSWDTPYGQFFLNWYCGSLLKHGDSVLSIANRVFSPKLRRRLHQEVDDLHNCQRDCCQDERLSSEEAPNTMIDGVKSWVGKAGMMFRRPQSPANWSGLAVNGSGQAARGSRQGVSDRSGPRPPSMAANVTSSPQDVRMGGGTPLKVYRLGSPAVNNGAMGDEMLGSSAGSATDVLDWSSAEGLVQPVHVEALDGEVCPPSPSSLISARGIFRRFLGFLGGQFGMGEGVELTLKVAGIHWWYRTRSHAAELTAGYNNTEVSSGYRDIADLCSRHGANMTLTCIEMCDEQHPDHAQCSPQGLLRQVRKEAHTAGVSLSGENALPIFIPSGCGVDTAALERIVQNAQECSVSDISDGECREFQQHTVTRGASVDCHQRQNRATGARRSLLPPLSSFTFLRLGPEILNPSHQGLWMRFMQGMQSWM